MSGSPCLIFLILCYSLSSSPQKNVFFFFFQCSLFLFMSTNISKKLQNTQMERTQKSQFLGVYCLHCVISWQTTHIYIQLQDTYKRSKSECTLLCRSEVKHNFEDSEQDTRKTWKSKTQLQSKVGNQGVGLQIHCRGPGLLHNLELTR